MALGSDTLVTITDRGDIPIREVRVGDYLKDHNDRPVRCESIAPPQVGPLKRVEYVDFASKNTVWFQCTPDHRLPLTACTVTPGVVHFLTRRGVDAYKVVWYTRCNRKYDPVREDAKILVLDEFIAQICRVYRVTNQREMQTRVDEIVYDYYRIPQSSENDFTKFLTDAERKLFDDCDSGSLQQALYDAIERNFVSVWKGPKVVHEYPASDDSDVESNPSGESSPTESQQTDWRPAESSKRSSQRPNPSGESQSEDDDPEDSDWVPDLESDQQDLSPADSQQGSEDISSHPDDSMNLVIKPRIQNKLNQLDGYLDSRVCPCKGFRIISATFDTEEDAKFVCNLLEGALYHRVDRCRVSQWDRFDMSISEFERVCTPDVRDRRLQLVRVPPGIPPSDEPSNAKPLTLDSYYVSFYLGDGSKNQQGSINSSDPEICDWLQEYVKKLNANKNEGYCDLVLSSYLGTKKGTGIRNTTYFANKDVYRYCIVTEKSGKKWYPLTKGLKKLGIYYSKEAGIPDEYMKAVLDDRLAFIAGLMESDGYYDAASNRYVFSQNTLEHGKIVSDLKKLAYKCGIFTSRVYEKEKDKDHMYRDKTGKVPVYQIVLSKGCEKFQHHLKIPRKRMLMTKSYNSRESRSLKVCDAESDEYTELNVKGRLLQVRNGLLSYE
jgi:hypothetical protein